LTSGTAGYLLSAYWISPACGGINRRQIVTDQESGNFQYKTGKMFSFLPKTMLYEKLN
jgi:hypothetical protein